MHLAQSTQDQTMLLGAHSLLGISLLSIGEFGAARNHLEQGLALYDPQRHRFMAALYGDDLGVTCQCFAAMALWFLGYPDQALQRVQQAVALAQELAIPYSQAFAHDFATWIHVHRRDAHAAWTHSEALMALVTEHGFRFWEADSILLRGWRVAAQGQSAEGLVQLHQGLAVYLATGAETGRPLRLALLAEACGQEGQPEEGLVIVAEALAVVGNTGEHSYEAELYRLKGALTLQSKVPSTQYLASSPQAAAEAEACFWKAIEIARKQQAKSLELRATVSLARLWQQQGKHREARDTLSAIYGWFTEGFDTKDLQAAKALLEEFSERGQ